VITCQLSEALDEWEGTTARRSGLASGAVAAGSPLHPRLMFNAAKDAIASRAAQTYLNNFIARYGKVERLKLDSGKRRVEVVCQLEGEPTPIAVTVGHYEVESESGKKFIRVSDCTCSRPWLQRVIADYTKDRRFELPSWAASAL
jgi:hypothetical protein